MSAIKACVFDAYGTLFDVNAAARDVANQPGKGAFAMVWQQVATDWRTKTLEYTWLRTISGHYVDFWQITEDALDWALEAADQADPDLRAELLGLFKHLKCYQEVPEVLGELKDLSVRAAILSNGTPDMIASAVASAGIEGCFDAILTVDSLQAYKPSKAVYELVGQTYGTAPDEVLFVSSNGWDAAAASAYGFATVWINRTGLPTDRLQGTPGREARDLSVVPDLVRDPRI